MKAVIDSAVSPNFDRNTILKLQGEALELAKATVRAQKALSRNDAASVGELRAFLWAKGLSERHDASESRLLRKRAKQYLTEEGAARVRSGEVWDALSDEKRVKMLHNVCNSEGDETYADPETGYTVFSAFGHLKRGYCCGLRVHENNVVERTHRCRHCPYNVKGLLTGKRWKGLQSRIAVIEYVRTELQNVSTQNSHE